MNTPVLLDLQNIHKSFGANAVLRGISMDVRRGEIHILAGENGAGKSTLMKILSGNLRADEGKILFQDKQHSFSSPQEAQNLGITMIHQELSLVDSLSIAENLFLGRTDLGFFYDKKKWTRAARRALQRVGLSHVDPQRAVGELPVAQQTLLEIAKALDTNAQLLILDEPTASLGPTEVRHFFGLLRELKAQGKGMIFISHRMEEIYEIGDRVTVLRDGIRSGQGPMENVSQDQLIQWMAGKTLTLAASKKNLPPKKTPLLRVHNFSSVRKEGGVPGNAFQNISFDLHPGEILGIAGLQGSGKNELLMALFGAHPHPLSGTIQLHGKSHRPRSPADSIKKGLMLLTPDRKRTGLILGRSIGENMVLPRLKMFSSLAWLHQKSLNATVEQEISQFQIRCTSRDQTTGELSGGNQQKVALAKCLGVEPQILLLDEPTRGVDVGAKAEIYQMMRQWASRGMGILLISSEMPELISLSHRILVLHRGQLSANLQGNQMQPDRVLHAAFGDPLSHFPAESP